MNDLSLARNWIMLQYAERPSTEYDELMLNTYPIVMEMIDVDPKRSLDFILSVIMENDSDFILENLGAGPLEDILVYHGNEIIEEVERLAHKNIKFKLALKMTWRREILEHVWSRVVSARE